EPAPGTRTVVAPDRRRALGHDPPPTTPAPDGPLAPARPGLLGLRDARRTGRDAGADQPPDADRAVRGVLQFPHPRRLPGDPQPPRARDGHRDEAGHPRRWGGAAGRSVCLEGPRRVHPLPQVPLPRAAAPPRLLPGAGAEEGG